VSRALCRWLWVLVAGLLAVAPARAPAAAREPLLLGDDERLLVFAPHPDDETLAAGGLIQEALALDLPVRVCFFTMGDNNEIASLFTRRHPVLMPGPARSAGLRRQNEALAAAASLGLASNDVVFLGYPDSGTLDVWNHHWRALPPYRSPLTKANGVPYDAALTPGSAYAGEDILDDLDEVLRDFRPTHVFVPHPADHNVDHRAMNLFVRVALWNLAADGGGAPAVLAYPAHFVQWPVPRGFRPDVPAEPPTFLAAEAWQEYALAPFQASNKLAALRRHHSQFLRAAPYFESFARKTELFAPLADLAFPGGVGAADLPERDDTQFRPDGDLLRDVAQSDSYWNDVAGQYDSEAKELADLDNDFLQRACAGDGVALTVSCRFRRPVAPAATLSIRLFGHRADAPFGDLPKIEIEIGPQDHLVVCDLNRKLPSDSIQLIPGGAAERTVRVPYALLGQPEKILVGAHLVKGTLPIDETPWVALDLAGAPLPDAPAPAPAPDFPLAAATPAAEPPAPAPEPPAQADPPASAPVVEPPADESRAPAPNGAFAIPTPPPTLAPRVHLPRRSIPEKTEANEPVVW